MSRANVSHIVILCLICVLSKGVSGAAQSAAQKSDKKSDTGVVATLAVTGCLERWTPAPGAAADPATAKPPAGVEFMLTQARGQAESATSAAATPQAAKRSERYLLLPMKGVDYAAHVNHQVQITGAIAPQPSAGASTAQQIADPSSRETNLPVRPEAESYDGSLVDVATFTMVSQSCAQ